MGIVNAVLVEWGQDEVGGYFWVTDDDSIDGTEDTPEWGRREGFVSFAGVTDREAAEAMATEWLSTRSQPAESLVVEVAPVEGAEPAVGDIITAGDHTNVTVRGMSWGLNRDTGDLVPVPEVNSILDEQRVRSELAVQRAVSVNGGRSSSSAPVRVTGSRLDSGKLEPVSLKAWSQSGALDAEDDEVWHAQPIPEPCRIIMLEATGKPKPSGTNFIVELLVNGVSFDPAITVELPVTDDRATTHVRVPRTLFPADVISIEITQVGDHDDLAIIPHAVKGA